jgi:hypothetical protein
MENRLAKKSLIVNIIGTILILCPLLLKRADLFVNSFESAKFAVILFVSLFFIGELLLFIGFIMGLISLKKQPRLVSFISISIDVIITVIWVIFVNSITEMF